MKIAELFYSLQGEGSLVGVPSFFIRTSGCNLRCAWCDTPYTSWRPEGTELPIDQILDEWRAHSARHVVVTGGEPMIAPEIVPLTHRLRAAGAHITIETAGTVAPPVACDLMSISPKLANSTPPASGPEAAWASRHERLRIQPPVLAELMGRYDYQLKFVVQTRADLEEVRVLVHELGAPAERVILMPEGVTAEVLRERSLWIAEACKEEGYRFSPRLHVDLYGNRRGI
ncbi:MAG TPA: 7-carboxy-7-deazaguanine synthase QueE [Bryobacteraceae bacterium]|nr:7-carboxy-7-deazaguanine synthase QueE [Bryobacteraceae bacterium]